MTDWNESNDMNERPSIISDYSLLPDAGMWVTDQSNRMQRQPTQSVDYNDRDHHLHHLHRHRQQNYRPHQQQ